MASAMAASTVCARPSTFRGPSARKTFSGKATRGVRAAGQFKVRTGDPGRHQDEDETEVTQPLFISAAEGDWLLRTGTGSSLWDRLTAYFAYSRAGVRIHRHSEDSGGRAEDRVCRQVLLHICLQLKRSVSGSRVEGACSSCPPWTCMYHQAIIAVAVALVGLRATGKGHTAQAAYDGHRPALVSDLLGWQGEPIGLVRRLSL